MEYIKEYRKLKELYQIPTDVLINDIINFRTDYAKNKASHDYFTWDDSSIEQYFETTGVNQFNRLTNSKYYYPLYRIYNDTNDTFKKKMELLHYNKVMSHIDECIKWSGGNKTKFAHSEINNFFTDKKIRVRWSELKKLFYIKINEMLRKDLSEEEIKLKEENRINEYLKSKNINKNPAGANVKKINHLKQGFIFQYKYKNFSRASLYYRVAIRRNPKLSSAYFHRGCCFFQMGGYDESIVDFDTVLSLQTNNILAYNTAYRLREWVLYYKKWAECHKNHKDILDLVNSAIDYKINDKNIEAIEIFDKTIKLCSDNAYVFYELGSLYGEINDTEMAEKYYSEAIKYAPNVADAYNARGYHYQKQKLYDKAIVDYTTAIDIYPRLVDAIINCGEVFYAQKKYELASEKINTVLEIDPDNEEAKIKIQKIKEVLSG